MCYEEVLRNNTTNSEKTGLR